MPVGSSQSFFVWLHCTKEASGEWSQLCRGLESSARLSSTAARRQPSADLSAHPQETFSDPSMPLLGSSGASASLHHTLAVYLSVCLSLHTVRPSGEELCSKWPVPPTVWHTVGAQKIPAEGERERQGRAGHENRRGLVASELLKSRWT